ncbi:hypothetical protein K491DRAFT_224603 [Lophiostoma macrostomum CBS 122681]|uniref:Uncharacterized protein n=1 Tax=Lophiostoma macrostomum CBS 122681 TaxID=1314788 RepID=A0A6A6TK46_9PLEO|nr:hypothetical protein K491DRAFT_224603 [Lophiostoma macrostomum CBS 122681]
MTAALTTTFSPPSQCTTDIYFVPWYTSGYYYYVLGGQDYSSCLPASFTPTSEFFYTPGLHCPHGYSGAKTDSVSVGDELATIITCCPSGFSIQDGNSHSYPWIATLGCFSGISSSVDLSITAVSSSMGLARVTAGAVNAYSVQLRFRAVDLIVSQFKGDT